MNEQRFVSAYSDSYEEDTNHLAKNHDGMGFSMEYVRWLEEKLSAAEAKVAEYKKAEKAVKAKVLPTGIEIEPKAPGIKEAESEPTGGGNTDPEPVARRGEVSESEGSKPSVGDASNKVVEERKEKVEDNTARPQAEEARPDARRDTGGVSQEAEGRTEEAQCPPERHPNMGLKEPGNTEVQEVKE